MVVGGLRGAALSRRNPPVRAGIRNRSRGRTLLGLVVRRGTLALASLAVVVLVAALARLASTEAISGSDGEPLPGEASPSS